MYLLLSYFTSLGSFTILAKCPEGLDHYRVQVHTILNTLSENTITHNESRGIIMINAKDNIIKDNTITNNKTLDMVDHSQNKLCTNKVNNWANNSIGGIETAMPACLKDQ
ncbi:right-handed parallel beta-helix repeat-containing protein [Microbulbifer epialgicus]|uniref:Right-handed parallel beta-helix repeat-containing protein n=1 Tax=Microbulbifer epialgicus TaxID=393907 RepID=A0ABV4P6B2_9GAMM